MERLDYRINEDGIERWISQERVMAILQILIPSKAQEIAEQMHTDSMPFEYTIDGKLSRIEYKGPGAMSLVVNKLGVLSLIAFFSLSIGCTRINKTLWGSDTKEDQVSTKAHALYVVACCQDNNGGTMTYPAFLPPAHVQLCRRATTACHDTDCQIDGDTYLPVAVDCGRHSYIGDQYYPATGY